LKGESCQPCSAKTGRRRNGSHTTCTANLGFWFEFRSTYSYLSMARIEGLAAFFPWSFSPLT